MRYVLHYTEPGDIVFDGFCGTGMTGVAAQLCGNKTEVSSLGYQVSPNQLVMRAESDGNGNEAWIPFSRVGARRALLNDLAPAATFVASNYADLHDLASFAQEAMEVIERSEEELKWAYESQRDGIVVRALWSDLFVCPNCSHELIFFEAALKGGVMRKSFPCPSCGSLVGKAASRTSGTAKLERPFTTEFDPALEKMVTIPKLALIEQTIKRGKEKLTYQVSSQERKELEQRFYERRWPSVPTEEFFSGRQTNKLINGSGISHIAHMYTRRALYVVAYLWERTLSSHRNTTLFRFCLTAINNYVSRKQGHFGGGGGVSGTLFTPSLHLERNVFDVFKRKINGLKSLSAQTKRAARVCTQSVVDLKNIPDNSIDYIFSDPPFGEPLQYAELNMFVETWLKTRTHVDSDCVLNYVHNKDLAFYSSVMQGAFATYSRVLKPKKWATIVFHNSQNSVWSAIQQAIELSGLVVADVRILDKQQRSFNAVNRSGALDQDLIISAYKPTIELERKLDSLELRPDTAWEFVSGHLNQLPVFLSRDGKVEIIAERQPLLLFDRMVAFHVQRGVPVPLSASEFYLGLSQRFSERDGMFFLPDQVAEFDKRRMTVREALQLNLYVTDESSAIHWVRQQLLNKPQTVGRLKPRFMQEISGWLKTEKLLELDEILEQNFIRYEGNAPVPEQIHAYLSSNWKELRNLPKNDPALMAKARNRWYVPDPNKAGDLEKLREKALIKEFEEYKKSKRTLKIFRLEAVRAGFKKSWQEHDYQTIIDIAEKIPSKILEEDSKLLMWYDQAMTRTSDGEEGKLT